MSWSLQKPRLELVLESVLMIVGNIPRRRMLIFSKLIQSVMSRVSNALQDRTSN